jgi:hypothetical protein
MIVFPAAQVKRPITVDDGAEAIQLVGECVSPSTRVGWSGTGPWGRPVC